MRVAILLSFIFLIGCSKKDDDTSSNETSQTSILGKWYYKENVVNGITIPYDDHEPCGKDYMEFINPNIVKSIDIFGCQPITDWTGTFQLNGSVLKITNSGETITCQVLELTTTSLVYKFNYDSDGNGTIDENIAKFDR